MNCMSESCALKKSSPSSIATTPRIMIEGRSALDLPEDTDATFCDSNVLKPVNELFNG